MAMKKARNLIITAFAATVLAGCSSITAPQNNAGMDQRASSNAVHSNYLHPSDPVMPDNPLPNGTPSQEYIRALLEGRPDAPGHFFQ